MYKLFAVFIVCLFISCEKNKSQEGTTNEDKQDTFILEKEDLKNLKYSDFILDNKSENKISAWLKYNELQEKIKELKNADLSYFKSDKEVVETLIKEFVDTKPGVINTNPINSRILVVQNMYLKLNSTVNLSTSTKAEIKKDITDLLEAFSNLNFQINKKFERDAQNIIKP